MDQKLRPSKSNSLDFVSLSLSIDGFVLSCTKMTYKHLKNEFINTQIHHSSNQLPILMHLCQLYRTYVAFLCTHVRKLVNMKAQTEKPCVFVEFQWMDHV